MIRGFIYRLTMKLGHLFNWHYAPPIYPEGDTQLWCKWCGFRQTVYRANAHVKGTTTVAIGIYRSGGGAVSISGVQK